MSAPEEFTPEVPDRFVRVAHEGTGATADIPEVALSLHEARGWHLVEEPDQPEPPSPETGEEPSP